ncbi:unnamed protein product [Bursaphelenchus okinawaensis]|uniref:Bax inhibitor-1 n=1 Tax=Bursaphelenchus okinawaensis TaxID=465554 RepID=A0A811JQM8_9BILA|nr:unnamed protein product [Bursaphelenchus okinawaensis]CAG9078360.1 unnamed protein product [Bursaphelenchus okinawaensis]
MTSFYQRASNPQETDILGNLGRVFTSLEHKLEKDVREHLRNVYATLTVAMFTAVLGVVANHLLNLYSLHFLCSIGIFGLTFALIASPATRETEKRRLGYLLGLSFLVGVTTGPLVMYIGASDPSVVFNAYIITLVVFGCFSLAALHAENTKFLHLGGILSAALLALAITSIFGRFSASVHPILIWGGLLINSAFIVYDTQMIAEKRRRGDTDYVLHTMELFIDFVNVFRYLLIILKERNDNQNRRRRD